MRTLRFAPASVACGLIASVAAPGSSGTVSGFDAPTQAAIGRIVTTGFPATITGAPVLVAGDNGAYAGSAASCVLSGPSDVAMRRAVGVPAR